jgi:UDP-N-acetylmuramoyl-L-alanyl-D-glutamate--2,6-diaminopimelate ligase
MQLTQLLAALKIKRIIGTAELDITGFAMDSRQVQPGYMYVVLTEPELQDRTQFIGAAIEAGAVAVLLNRERFDIPSHITQVIVPETQIASAYLAAQFYDHPADELALVGITGTKGKTTTSYLVRHILQKTGIATGIIGTTGASYDEYVEASNTTPHAIKLQRVLRQMADLGCQAVSMEVSSHALRLHRIAGLAFDVAVFTNIGSDHMNFHPDMADYIQAKSLLLSKVINGVCVLNADDPHIAQMLLSVGSEALTYGLGEQAALRAVDIVHSTDGTRFLLTTSFGDYTVTTRLVGLFNVYNTLAALGAAYSMGISLDVAINAIADFNGVAGRMESIDTQGLGFGVYVDYAHTPESMENVLQTLVAAQPRRLVTVFGAGGDRDRAKRPRMAIVAARYSTHTIVTSDNPRTENPQQILADIAQGFVEVNVSESCYDVIADRKQAIERAIDLAQPGDMVVILGKGDETYQEINHVRYPFDDRAVARQALQSKH